MAGGKGGRPARQYDPAEAKLVQACSQYGEPQEDTAARLGCDVRTMLRLYRKDWEKGAREAKLTIRKTLFEQAKAGVPPLLIFYCKTQLGMKETQQVDLTSSDGSLSPTDITIELVKADSHGED